MRECKIRQGGIGQGGKAAGWGGSGSDGAHQILSLQGQPSGSLSLLGLAAAKLLVVQVEGDPLWNGGLMEL